MFLGTPRVKCLVLYLVPVITLLTILLSILVSPLSFLNYLLIILLNFLISLLNTMRTKRLALSLLIPVTTTTLLRGVVVIIMTGIGTMLGFIKHLSVMALSSSSYRKGRNTVVQSVQ